MVTTPEFTSHMGVNIEVGIEVERVSGQVSNRISKE